MTSYKQISWSIQITLLNNVKFWKKIQNFIQSNISKFCRHLLYNCRCLSLQKFYCICYFHYFYNQTMWASRHEICADFAHLNQSQSCTSRNHWWVYRRNHSILIYESSSKKAVQLIWLFQSFISKLKHLQ